MIFTLLLRSVIFPVLNSAGIFAESMQMENKEKDTVTAVINDVAFQSLLNNQMKITKLECG